MSELIPISCKVGGEIAVLDAPGKLVSHLRREFSYVNPEHVRASRFGDDRGIPPRVSCARERADGSVLLPRGDVARVRSILTSHGYDPKWIDTRSHGADLKVPRNDIAPRDYQQAAIDALIECVQGIVVLPCAGGKTTIGVATIARLKRSAIVLVHTDDLADQWTETLTDKLGIVPARIGSGRYEFGAVTVASVFSVIKCLDDPGFTKFGIVVIDECHHAPASTFSTVLRALPARWRLGLTATPEREDRVPVDWFVGPMLCRRTADELIAAGHLMRPSIERVDTGFIFTSKEATRQRIPALERALTSNEQRNRLIGELATRDAMSDESILVLTNRVDHASKLGKTIAALGVAVGTITGRTAKKRRKGVLADLKSGALRCVVATNLADEGLDVPRLSRIVLAFPMRAEGATVQRVGRLMRKHDGKMPRLYDIVDPRVPTLVRRWQARSRAYRKLGLMI